MIVGYDICLYGYTGMWYCVRTDQVKPREGERRERREVCGFEKLWRAHLLVLDRDGLMDEVRVVGC